MLIIYIYIDFTQIRKLEEKKTALEAQVEILMYENENLKSSMSKQTNELQAYQKGSLTQDQTASLLQELKVLEEKLDKAQKGKSFFKEQWGKAVREIHRLKVDTQQAMEVQIKNSREELKNVEYVLWHRFHFTCVQSVLLLVKLIIKS